MSIEHAMMQVITAAQTLAAEISRNTTETWQRTTTEGWGHASINDGVWAHNETTFTVS